MEVHISWQVRVPIKIVPNHKIVNGENNYLSVSSLNRQIDIV